MNKMKIFNLVYKIKNPKTEKSCAVNRLKMPYSVYLNRKRFIKSLPSCKYVNPLGWSYVKVATRDVIAVRRLKPDIAVRFL